MKKETLNDMTIHADLTEMASGHYWCLDMENTRTSIVYWHKEGQYFSIIGDKRKYFATHFAKGVMFIGKTWIDTDSLDEAAVWYRELKDAKPKEGNVIILPLRDKDST